MLRLLGTGTYYAKEKNYARPLINGYWSISITIWL